MVSEGPRSQRQRNGTTAGPPSRRTRRTSEEAKKPPRPANMRASPSTAARQTMSALEMGDLDADAFGQAPVSLRFRHGPLEDRYRSYRARRARELGANAVVGVDLDYEVVGQSMLMVSASGTAVTVS